jgi:predicted amidohydrolase
VSIQFRYHGARLRRFMASASAMAVWLAGMAAIPQRSGAGEIQQQAGSAATLPRDRLPRKVLVGTEVSGYDLILKLPLEMRLQRMDELVDSMAAQATLNYPGKQLDLVVLTEYFMSRPGDTLEHKAVRLEEVQSRIAACAKSHRCYMVVPFILNEGGSPALYSNAAVLMDREGRVAGIYRKVHPCSDLKEVLLEDGMTPGRNFPVFDCDFGKVGIQICYDIFFADGWQALAKQGAEIVALASETPETVRPSMYALQHRYFIVSATPRDHAAVYSPLGVVEAQTTQEGVMVHQIDLSYAIVGWEDGLDGGKGVTRKFGDRVGYNYYSDQDVGIFWSNDPTTSIGKMISSLGFPDLDRETEQTRVLQDKFRGGPPVVP